MKRRSLLSLLLSSALAVSALVILPAGSAQARPGEVAPCYGVREAPPPPAPAPKKPARPSKPRAK